MNDLSSDPMDVPAPKDALAWSPSRGFVSDITDLERAHTEGEVVLGVSTGLNDDATRVVQAVEGYAPLTIAIRQDRQLHELWAYIAELHGRLLDIFEYANEALVRR